MDDTSIASHIEALVAEEHSLQEEAGDGRAPSVEQHERLQAVRVELDRYWDLLRQRRAREEFDLDPDFVGLRDPKTVEGFEQ
jgi:hypothetical protein